MIATRPRTRPEDLLLDLWRFLDMSAEERDRERSLACRTAMDQWMAVPEERRFRWAEPGPAGEEILRRWARECREAGTER